MQTLKHYLPVLLLLIFTSCNVGPAPINYGSDSCQFCTMTIVDKVHAAQIVTQKGKVYKFDATECMINFTKEFNTSEIQLYLSNNYTEPEILIDATKATFLISEQIPSPMGAFLSAFKNKSDAEKFQADNGGQLYTWNQLLSKLNN
ncbi:nitrous oxide reductase accessory protein NosL [Winogradskyella undariae]|uniref:nitrous oxide reductase accessory protein NosL n=1 Tax=Winogradskyella TaxID=286104 RepID=UPI00156AA692|nr:MULTISPECIES: nitrous oxide reductase accessory protein NosL [Winogradskyella]NRR92170.1 nitrous oxide reductase accessory protein NosL [Winogradskyella undariae]QXP80227.1 nitrous oxide reductase accessory protein NosL [Winogradskyella sp. HaHa_3_26]